MKKIISILAFTSMLCCSCDYLDVVPEGKATEEDIWKTTEQADKFRYYLQTYMPNLIGYDWSPDQFAGDDFITGARGTTYYFSSKSLLYNEETSSNTYFGRWEPSSVSGGTNYDIYRGIRYCYYMLDNVYKVPVISPENADRYAGEAWFLIGYYHQCLLEYYGPVILVKRFIPIDAPEEEIFVPRTPYDDCVKFIADCYDKAAGTPPRRLGGIHRQLPFLPVVGGGSLRGIRGCVSLGFPFILLGGFLATLAFFDDNKHQRPNHERVLSRQQFLTVL